MTKSSHEIIENSKHLIELFERFKNNIYKRISNAETGHIIHNDLEGMLNECYGAIQNLDKSIQNLNNHIARIEHGEF